jgi:hypothetical protein
MALWAALGNRSETRPGHLPQQTPGDGDTPILFTFARNRFGHNIVIGITKNH